ncbi:MAG: hypothetical protein M1269_11665 [Chloroflexi bacterium]|nr:hypothetical protein [Chloroflexota bacterium]
MAVCPACNNEWEPATPICPQCGYDMSKAQEQAPAGAEPEGQAQPEPEAATSSRQEEHRASEPAFHAPPPPGGAETRFNLEPPGPGEDVPLPPERPLLMGEYLSKSWRILTENIGLFLLFTIVVLVISSIPVANFVLLPVVLAGFMTVTFMAARGQKFDFNDFFSNFPKTLDLFLAYLITSIFVSIGIVFCILPGIYLSVAYMLVYAVIADSGLDFWKAMEFSRRLVTRQWFSFFLFSLLLCVINLAGLLALGVGFLFTMPLSMIAIAIAYEHQVHGLL